MEAGNKAAILLSGMTHSFVTNITLSLFQFVMKVLLLLLPGLARPIHVVWAPAVFLLCMAMSCHGFGFLGDSKLFLWQLRGCCLRTKRYTCMSAGDGWSRFLTLIHRSVIINLHVVLEVAFDALLIYL